MRGIEVVEEQTQQCVVDNKERSLLSTIKNNRIIQTITLLSIILACSLLVSDNKIISRVVTSSSSTKSKDFIKKL